MYAMNVKIKNIRPHYSNLRFRNAQLVWGEPCEVEMINYSDRLYEWDYEKSELAHDTAIKKHEIDTAAYYQEYLSVYHAKMAELKYIMAGFNVYDGFPYQVFGYNLID